MIALNKSFPLFHIFNPHSHSKVAQLGHYQDISSQHWVVTNGFLTKA